MKPNKMYKLYKFRQLTNGMVVLIRYIYKSLKIICRKLEFLANINHFYKKRDHPCLVVGVNNQRSAKFSFIWPANFIFRNNELLDKYIFRIFCKNTKLFYGLPQWNRRLNHLYSLFLLLHEYYASVLVLLCNFNTKLMAALFEYSMKLGYVV